MTESANCPHCDEETDAGFYDISGYREDEECNSCGKFFSYKVKAIIVDIRKEEFRESQQP